MLKLTFHVLLQRKPRGCFCPPTPPLHYGRGASEEKIAEHDSQCLTHRVSFKNRWVRKPAEKITYLTVGLNIIIAVANSVWSNTQGSYYYKCEDGFVKNGATCEGEI